MKAKISLYASTLMEKTKALPELGIPETAYNLRIKNEEDI